MNTGVYGIYYNQRLIYIGSAALSFTKRWGQHLSELNHNKHVSTYLQNIVNKHGIDALTFQVLEHCASNACVSVEQVYLDSYFHEGLANTCSVAGSSLGVKKTEEQIEAMRLRSTEMWKNLEYRELQSTLKRGKSNSRKGTKLSDEHKSKLRKAWETSPPRLSSKGASDKRRTNPARKGRGKNGFEYTCYRKKTNNYIGRPPSLKTKIFDNQLDAYLYVYSQIAIHNNEYCEVRN